MPDTRMSAFISAGTKKKVERYAESHGLKKGHLVEEALLHHLQALRELPPDILIPPRVALSRASFAKVARLVRNPRKPTKALRNLMRGKRTADEPEGW